MSMETFQHNHLCYNVVNIMIILTDIRGWGIWGKVKYLGALTMPFSCIIVKEKCKTLNVRF